MNVGIDNSAITLPQASTPERVNPILRVLPSFTDLVAILTLVFLFTCMSGTHSMLGDGDTGWHVRTGQWILANHKVPRNDMFSYTMPGTPWFAWEWLWDIAFAVIYNFSGLGGVVVGSLVVLCATMALLFRLVRRKCENVLIAFGVTMVAVAGSSLHWLARPHMFTLLFGVIFLSILERAKDALDGGRESSARRSLWLLPPLTVLWVNLHAGFVLGWILIGCYTAGEAAEWLVAPRGTKRSALRSARMFCLAGVGCGLASLANPYFTALHQHMFQFLRGSYAYDHISEYQSVSFHSALAWTWELMIVMGAISAFRELLRQRFVYAFVILVWTHLGLVAGRNIPIFMLVTAPIVAWNLAELLSSYGEHPDGGWLRRASAAFDRLAGGIALHDRFPRLHLASFAALAIVCGLVFAPNMPAKLQPQYDTNRYPAKALEFLGGAGIQNRIFTDDEWGDYLLYTLYPTKVFIDGRADMYGERFNLAYIDINNVKYDWEQSLAHYGVDTILLPVGAPLSGALKESSRWSVVYDDGVAIVFRPAHAAPVRRPDAGQGPVTAVPANRPDATHRS